MDGTSLPTHPCDPKAPEISANLPAMIGSVHDEAAMPAGEKMDEVELQRRVRD
ncbi:MAG: hypothetical protein NTW28_02215 [Candidatus Solibacter sp.]|nr:hypothetical protein [Candidatus Solibacter sp.]